MTFSEDKDRAPRMSDDELRELILRPQERLVPNLPPSPPIYQAIEAGSLKRVRRILEETPGAVADRDPVLNEDPIHSACHYGRASIVKLLIDSGADVNALDDDGKTPLHRAVQNGNAKAVKVLLASGADANAVNDSGYSVLQLALLQIDDEKIPQILIEHGCEIDIAAAVLLGDLNRVREIVATSPDAVSKHKLKNTFLENVIVTASERIRNKEVKDRESAIQAACQLIEFLMDAGVDPNAASGGTPPLHLVAGRPELGTELVVVLLRKGADPNQRNFAEQTAREVAEDPYCHNDPVVRLLAEREAD